MVRVVTTVAVIVAALYFAARGQWGAALGVIGAYVAGFATSELLFLEGSL